MIANTLTKAAIDYLMSKVTNKVISKVSSQVSGAYNRLKVPAGHFGVPRIHMPQIDAGLFDEFKRYLKRNGVEAEEQNVPVSSLHLYQNEYNKDKVLNIMNGLTSAKAGTRPIIISKDGYVLDGSHRFLACYNTQSIQRMRALVIPMDALKALEVVRSFSGARYRRVSDNKVPK